MKNQELQLLYVFDAIMTERSVTRAAERLAMTAILPYSGCGSIWRSCSKKDGRK